MSPPYNIQDRTFEFSIAVVTFCREIWHVNAVTRHLGYQLLKSATSVGANMEEADGGQSPDDFISKVAIARKESKEAVYWLRLMAATDSHVRHRIPSLLDEAKQIEAIVSAIQRNAESNQKRAAAAKTVLILIGSGFLMHFLM
jgi:four helix bundle protein